LYAAAKFVEKGTVRRDLKSLGDRAALKWAVENG